MACRLLVAAMLVGCHATLRVPAPAPDTDGAAPPATSPSYAIAPPREAGAAPTLVVAPDGGTDGGGADSARDAGPPEVPPPQVLWTQEGTTRYLRLPTYPVGLDRAGRHAVDLRGDLWTDDGNGHLSFQPTLDSAAGIAADGSSVFGETSAPNLVPGFDCAVGAVWTPDATFKLPFASRLVAASANSSVFAGNDTNDDCPVPFGGPYQAIAWRGAQITWLGTLPGTDHSEALAISADGSTIAGTSWVSQGGTHTPFIQTAAGLVKLVGYGDLQSGVGLRLSANGSVVGGTLLNQYSGAYDHQSAAFLWSAGKLTYLPWDVFGPTYVWSVLADLSADGTVALVLQVPTTQKSQVQPVSEPGIVWTWSAARGVAVLATPPGMTGFVEAVMTPDARWIVASPWHDVGTPVVWEWGLMPKMLFGDAPEFLAKCRPIVTHLAGNGKTFAGRCTASEGGIGFVARVP